METLGSPGSEGGNSWFSWRGGRNSGFSWKGGRKPGVSREGRTLGYQRREGLKGLLEGRRREKLLGLLRGRGYFVSWKGDKKGLLGFLEGSDSLVS